MGWPRWTDGRVAWFEVGMVLLGARNHIPRGAYVGFSWVGWVGFALF